MDPETPFVEDDYKAEDPDAGGMAMVAVVIMLLIVLFVCVAIRAVRYL